MHLVADQFPLLLGRTIGWKGKGRRRCQSQEPCQVRTGKVADGCVAEAGGPLGIKLPLVRILQGRWCSSSSIATTFLLLSGFSRSKTLPVPRMYFPYPDVNQDDRRDVGATTVSYTHLTLPTKRIV